MCVRVCVRAHVRARALSLASFLLKTKELEKVELNEFKALHCREEKDSI